MATKKESEEVIYDFSLITEYDVYLFKEGKHYRLYEKLGAHLTEYKGEKGVYFAVWSPNAESVSVIGSFNDWDPSVHKLKLRKDGSGIWEGFIPGLNKGMLYKYKIYAKNGYVADKADPFSFFFESPKSGAASVIWDLEYEWNDDEWMIKRKEINSLNSPISIYEVHIGSWRRVNENGERHLTYLEIAKLLPDYVKEMGFTHVEFLPIMEHPFYGSWGYQTVGYFAPTSRYGKPQDFMKLIDSLHEHGIGVFLDWVPSHFPSDEYGLAYFDGTYLYEYEDPKKRIHPDWNSYIFDYGKNEVRAFLISSALFWLDKYHADGIRIDAVSSMLYLDFSRGPGRWTPNIYGGRENLEAISFIKELNEVIHKYYPDVKTIAEESTAWPNVTKPTYIGGLGFDLKWNMGWMNDILLYFSKDPIYRKYHHGILPFLAWYAYSENYVLPLSHDEVVYGKKSLLSKMPGDEWQKFANLRLLLAFMYAFPGKKLLFMGGEFGQWNEWNHESGLDWHLLKYENHAKLQKLVRDLNKVYKEEDALHSGDCDYRGFEWIDYNDWEQSVISFIRKNPEKENMILIVCNFTPVPRTNYRIGVPAKGFWREIINTDAKDYGGSGWGNFGGVEATNIPFHGRPYSVVLSLPPLACLYLKRNF